MGIISYWRNKVAKLPKELKYILLLFLSTRIILIIIGVTSRLLITPIFKNGGICFPTERNWLSIWMVWDSGWYLQIAKQWYPRGVDLSIYSNWGFFPLYPLLIKIVGVIVHSNTIAGLIVSNVFLLVAPLFLYKLVRLSFDDRTAFKTIRNLFLFPTAFIFSGIFTESLYLALTLMSFFYARKNRWLLAGVSGFFLSLTRPYGVLIILPLLYEYFKSRNFHIGKIRIEILSLILILLGLFTFFAFIFYQTGDCLAFLHAKRAWENAFRNPFKSLIVGLSSVGNINIFFNACFTIVALLLLTICYRMVGFSYWLFGFYSIFTPLLFTGVNLSMMRYILPNFPLYIILAKLGKNESIDLLIIVSLTLLQGFLMVFWCNGFNLIV